MFAPDQTSCPDVVNGIRVSPTIIGASQTIIRVSQTIIRVSQTIIRVSQTIIRGQTIIRVSRTIIRAGLHLGFLEWGAKKDLWHFFVWQYFPPPPVRGVAVRAAGENF